MQYVIIKTNDHYRLYIYIGVDQLTNLGLTKVQAERIAESEKIPIVTVI